MLKKIVLRFSALLISIFIMLIGTYKVEYKKNDSVELVKEVNNTIDIPNSKLKLSQIKMKNSDVQAWINIPGTLIDWPIMKWIISSVDGNPFYDRRDENKNYSYAGSIYSAEGINFSPLYELSNNLILHGHNLDDNPDGKKFAQLMKFMDIKFAENTPYIFITTDEGELIYQIYAVYFTDINFNCYWVGLDEKGQLEMVQGAKERSEYIYDVEVSGKDKIITLSTCTYRYGKYQSVGQKNTRFVIQGKLLSSNNNLKPNVSLKRNPSPKQPMFN